MDEVMRQAYERARNQGWSGTPEMWVVAWQVAQTEDARIADLSMLVKKLCLALRKAAPAHALPDQAVDYLRRKGIAGSPLRAVEGVDSLFSGDPAKLTPVQAALRRLLMDLAGGRRGEGAAISLTCAVPERLQDTWRAERIDDGSMRLIAPDGESWVVNYADETDPFNDYVWNLACRLVASRAG